MTGGTGLYLRALTEGLFAGPERQTGLRGASTRAQTKARRRMAAPPAHAPRPGIGRAHSRKRHAQADSRHRGVSGRAEADVGSAWPATR